jgi:hypothetical protein
MRFFSALVLAAVSNPAHSPASPDLSGLFKIYDLFGEWAVDCKAQASPENPHVVVNEPEPGRVIERHDLGQRYGTNTYRMLNAHRVSATRIGIEAVFQPGSEAEQTQEIVLSVRDGARRTMFTRVQGGAVRVKDGAVVGYDVRTPTLRKCE